MTMSAHLSPPYSPAPIDCDTAGEALAAQALGALDADERAALETHLRACPGCRAELDRYASAVDALDAAVSPVAPPAALRERLLAEIGAPAAASAHSPAPTAPPVALDAVRLHRSRVTGSRFAAAALALVASLLVAGIVVTGVLLHRTQVERDRAQSGQEVAEYLGEGGTIAPLTAAAGTSGGTGAGSLVVAPHQDEALLVVSGLAPSDDAHRYHVWAARAGQRTHLADLSVTSDGTGWLLLSGPSPLRTYESVGITLETGGGTRDLLTASVPRTAA